MQRTIGILFRFALLGSVACAGLRAQVVTTAQIKGTVQDETGAAVPGAEVKVTQTGTGASRTVTSAADGGYLFPQLPIGPYELQVIKMGFTKYVQTGIVLQVNSNPTIDATLKVGAVNEQVEVQAAAGMVETQSTGIGQVIDQQRVVDLPLNGRNVTDLLYLTGGVNAGRTFRASSASSVSVSVAGGGNGTVSYVLDGGTHNDPLSNQNLPLPFPDALQEFKVETSALPAQYGYHSAGAVNAVTKSGTNAIHGDAFEFAQLSVQRAQQLPAGARLAEAQPVRRHHRRPDCEEQIILLRRLSGQYCEVFSSGQRGVCSYRTDAGGRFFRCEFHRLPRGAGDAAGFAGVQRQYDRQV